MKSEFAKNVWIKNSVSKYSGTIPQRTLTKIVEAKLDEANDSSDIEKYEYLIRDIISRVEVNSIIDRICSVIPMSGPSGKIPVISSKYTGKNSNNVAGTDVIDILTLSSVTGLAENDKIYGPAGVGTVLYIEDNQVLVKVDSGSFTVNDTIDKHIAVVGKNIGTGDGTTTTFNIPDTPVVVDSETIYVDGTPQVKNTDYTIDYTTGVVTFAVAPTSGAVITADYEYVQSIGTISSIRSNIPGVGGIFKDYSGPYTTAVVETKQKSDLNKISLVVNKLSVEAKSRELATDISVEFIQDLINMYGADGYDKIVSVLSTVIIQEIESEIFDFMKSIATPQPDLVLSNSIGASDSLESIYGDIYSRLYFSIGRIGTNTNISGKFFAIGSSNTIAALSVVGDIEQIEDAPENSKLVGLLDGNIILIEDPYSTQDYLLVGLVGPDNMDNAGVIFSPYLIDTVFVKDSKTLEDVIAIMARYDIKRNILDTKSKAGESDFFELTNIDFSGLINRL